MQIDQSTFIYRRKTFQSVFLNILKKSFLRKHEAAVAEKKTTKWEENLKKTSRSHHITNGIAFIKGRKVLVQAEKDTDPT